MSRLGRGMRRGLNGAGDGLFIDKNKQNKTKLPRRGKQDSWKAWQGRTGQDRTQQDTCDDDNINDELARDCKHKEIIKGANEEGNEINTGGAN